MSKYGLLIDYKYCTGCHVCELACKNEYSLSDGEWGIKVCELGPVKLEEKWMWDYVPVPSDLCSCCADRIEQGEKAACEKHCLGQCLEVLPIEELAKRIAADPETKKLTCFIP